MDEEQLCRASRLKLAMGSPAAKTPEQVGEIYYQLQRLYNIRVEDVDALVVLLRYKPKGDKVSPLTAVSILMGGTDADFLNTDYVYLGNKETLESLLQNGLLELVAGGAKYPTKRKV